MNLLLAVIFTIFSSPIVFAQQQEQPFEYGSCSFACKSIPPDSEVPRYFGQATASQLKATRLNVLVWNLYKGRKEEFLPAFLFLSENRDLVLVSEATTSDPVTTAFDLLPNFAWNFSVSFLLKDEVGTGTAIGSYANALEVKHYRTKDIEPFVNSPKAITSAKFAIAGSKETLLVLSIHGINWSGDEAIVRQVQDVMPAIMAHAGPVLFAGDFNFKNATRLTEVTELLATAGVDRVNWENPLKKQLDDAFTRGLKVHRAYLNNEHINTGSDHPAIELDVELMPGASKLWRTQRTQIPHFKSVSIPQ